MFEPFEIIDPVERFLEAREEGGAAGWGRQTKPNQALWLAGAAVCLTATLILVRTLSPRVGDEFASRLNKQSVSDMVSQHHASSRQPDSRALALMPATLPPTRAVHAVEPEASAARSSEGQVQTSQKPAPLSNVPSGQFSAANSEQSDQVISQPDDEQWVKTSLAAKVHSEPSVSAPILTYHPVGTQLRAIGHRNGWVEIVDPTTSQQGWIYEIYLSPSKGPAHRQDVLPQPPQTPVSEQQPTQAELETLDESGVPDASAPAAKSKELRKYQRSNRHHARRAIVIRFGSRSFGFRF